MSTSHVVLKLFRKLHLYIGLFTAPALIFFAFTGALQSFNLHETTQGSSYKPPAWLVAMAQLHKKQTTVVPVRRPRPTADAPGGAKAGGPGTQAGGAVTSGTQAAGTQAPAPKSHLPMKIFFLVVSVGLFVSTVTGVYMSYRYTRGKWVVTGWLVAGTVLPLLLLPF